MSAQSVEVFLARLYSDSKFRAQFESSPEAAFAQMDLDDSEKSELRSIDRVGLQFASASYASKRDRHGSKKKN